MLMSNGEHDSLYRSGMGALPKMEFDLKVIKRNLQVSNMLTISKEFKDLGLMSDKEYANDLLGLMEMCWTKEDEFKYNEAEVKSRINDLKRE